MNLFCNSHRAGLVNGYSCIEGFVLRHGKEYTPRRLSPGEIAYVKRVADRTLIPFETKQCFHNSQMLLMHDHEQRLEYVEGYLAHAFLPTLHGWITINGKVVDLTARVWRLGKPIHRHPYGAGVFGRFKSREYFGVAIERDKVLDRMFKHKETASLLDDWKEKWPLLKGEQA
jgi:hypothetical protein